MRRRAFIAGVAAAAALPLTARAQQRERVRRIGVLVSLRADDPMSQVRNAALLQGLGELGWHVGRNLQVDYRWSTGDAGLHSANAAELLASAPEVIVAVGATVVAPLLAATRSVPIVFVQVTDAVGSGFVTSLARPGGNATGFTLFEFGISAKWIELLKEIAPNVTRAAVLLDPLTPAGLGMLGAIQSVAPRLGVELSPARMRDVAEMEGALAAFARGSNDGLIVLPSAPAVRYLQQIVAHAARHKLPAIFPFRSFVSSGGLASYGPDETEQYRQTAGYVDRILKGEKPADLPVQAPTKYELAINLKTAKALGLAVPSTLLARADEVIE